MGIKRESFSEYFSGDGFRVGESKRDSVVYMEFQQLFMGDWDLPDSRHPKQSVTIPNLYYGLGILRRDVYFRPHHYWRVYQTPGGMRAFLTSSLQPYSERTATLAKDLGVDPLYVEATKKFQSWWCRVSPKPGRRGDYVARYITTIRGRRAKEMPEAQKLMEEHDSWCGRGWVPKSVIQLVYEDGYTRKCRPLRLILPREAASFVRAINASPYDEGPRLIFSDWLMENGATDRIVNMVRNGWVWAREFYRPTPTPQPKTGDWTDWRVRPWSVQVDCI